MWQRPSKNVRDLIVQGAEMLADLPAEQLDELQKAALGSAYMQVIDHDPQLAMTVRRGIWSNLLHWAAANISRPGEPVPPNSGELSDLARGIARRGLHSPISVDAYRVGQNIAWQFWMATAFQLTSDPAELRELLEVSARSMSAFIDDTVAEVYAHLQAERDKLASEMHAERRQVLAQILSGGAVHRQAESQLGYRLAQRHTAAVIWAEKPGIDPGDLDRAVQALSDAPDGRAPLSVRIDDTTRWVWVPVSGTLDLTGITTAVSELPGIRIALGLNAGGVDGFRRSHLDAITTQRMMMRQDCYGAVASFADVQLVALVTADGEQADRFIRHTLGEFESAGRDLQRTVLIFIHEQCNGSRTAERLFTHRNTVLRKISQAEQLLPRPLADNSVNVAVALEALRWRDSRIAGA